MRKSCPPRWIADIDSEMCAMCAHYRADREFNFRWCALHIENPRFPSVICAEFAER